MLTTSLGACDQFVRGVRRSNLIASSQLEQVVGNYLRVHLRAEPAALANHLVGEELLTRFQAERLLKGDTQELVLGPYVLMELAGFGNMGPVFKVLSKTDNHWYALIVCQTEPQTEHFLSTCSHPDIGVDVGLKSFLTDSDGHTVENPRYYRTSQKTLIPTCGLW